MHEYIYTQTEWDAECEAAADMAEVTAAWQYDDEVRYCEKLAISYPRTAATVKAARWLVRQGYFNFAAIGSSK